MNGYQRLLSDLGVRVIRNLTEAERAMYEDQKAKARARYTREGKAFGECRGCGTFVGEPKSPLCPQCRRALAIVEPVKPAA